MATFDHAVEAAEFLRGRGFGGADVAVVLGSGLGDFAERLDEPFELAYRDIPHWPASTIVGHAGRLVGGARADATSSRCRAACTSTKAIRWRRSPSRCASSAGSACRG